MSDSQPSKDEKSSGNDASDSDPSPGSSLDMLASIETQYLDEMEAQQFETSEVEEATIPGSDSPSTRNESGFSFDMVDVQGVPTTEALGSNAKEETSTPTPGTPETQGAPPTAAGTMQSPEEQENDPNDDPTQVYQKEQVVWCKPNGNRNKAKVIGVHFDKEFVPYYTILLPNGRERQTDNAHLEPCVSTPEEYMASALLREHELKKKLQLEKERNKELQRAVQKLDNALKRNLKLEMELKGLQKSVASNAPVPEFGENGANPNTCLVSLTTKKRWMMLATANVLHASLVGLGWCYRWGSCSEMEPVALFLATSAAVTLKKQFRSLQKKNDCQPQ